MRKDYIDFEIHDSLNPKLWDGDTLKPEVRKKLLKIANAFHKYLNLDAKIKDVIITGSSSNYNYSDEYSDIDLHVLYDFSEILAEDDDEDDEIEDVEDLVKEYINSKKAIWNDKFDIKVNGIEVELYGQDVDEEHEANGQFSIVKNLWIKKPTKDNPKFSEETAENIAKQIRDLVDKKMSSKASHEDMEEVKEKIWDIRKQGLESAEGEFSNENLAFKILRRDGTIEKLLAYMDDVYGSELSGN